MSPKLNADEIIHHFAQFKHGTVEELAQDIQQVGEIAFVPITSVWKDKEGFDDNEAIPSRVALYNMKMRNNPEHGFIEIVSSKYENIQPRMNFLNVVRALAGTGVQTGSWKIMEAAKGNMASLVFLFERMYTDPTGSDCFPGVYITTYSDGKGAVYVQFFWWRKWCTNGAKGNMVVKEKRIEHKKKLDDDGQEIPAQQIMDEQIRLFLQELAVGENELFNHIIPDAHNDIVDGERAWLLIAHLPVYLQKQIMDRFVHGTEKNRYYLFNLATELIGTCGESAEIISGYIDMAENILMNRAKPRKR